MVAFSNAQTWMSVAEFLNWDSGDHLLWQLVDGEPRAMAPANTHHSNLQAELARIIGNHLIFQNMPCRVYVNPGVIPKTMSAVNMRIPDLAVSCSEVASKQPALTHPVVTVEILSPSNQAETWTNVWAYTTVPSVREILILRADIVGGKLLTRESDGSWPDQPATLKSEIALGSIGFRVSLAELYSRTQIPLG